MSEVRNTVRCAENLSLHAGKNGDADENGNQVFGFQSDRQDKKQQKGNDPVWEKQGKCNQDAVNCPGCANDQSTQVIIFFLSPLEIRLTIPHLFPKFGGVSNHEIFGY